MTSRQRRIRSAAALGLLAACGCAQAHDGDYGLGLLLAGVGFLWQLVLLAGLVILVVGWLSGGKQVGDGPRKKNALVAAGAWTMLAALVGAAISIAAAISYLETPKARPSIPSETAAPKAEVPPPAPLTRQQRAFKKHEAELGKEFGRMREAAHRLDRLGSSTMFARSESKVNEALPTPAESKKLAPLAPEQLALLEQASEPNSCQARFWNPQTGSPERPLLALSFNRLPTTSRVSVVASTAKGITVIAAAEESLAPLQLLPAQQALWFRELPPPQADTSAQADDPPMRELGNDRLLMLRVFEQTPCATPAASWCPILRIRTDDRDNRILLGAQECPDARSLLRMIVLRP